LAELPVDYELHHFRPEGQNAQSHAKMRDGSTMDPNFGRAITNHEGRLRGYNYHPEGNPKASYRATERYRDGRVVRYV